MQWSVEHHNTFLNGNDSLTVIIPSKELNEFKIYIDIKVGQTVLGMVQTGSLHSAGLNLTESMILPVHFNNSVSWNKHKITYLLVTSKELSGKLQRASKLKNSSNDTAPRHRKYTNLGP